MMPVGIAMTASVQLDRSSGAHRFRNSMPLSVSLMEKVRSIFLQAGWSNTLRDYCDTQKGPKIHDMRTTMKEVEVGWVARPWVAVHIVS